MNTAESVAGRVALVTGASRGIGLAIARRLAQMGASVGMCGRDRRSHCKSAGRELRSEGANILAVPADVSHAADIESLVKETEQALGPIEFLVNNAGIGYFGPIHEAAEANWDAVLDTNLKSVFLLSKAVAPGMIQRKAGHIINIASLAGEECLCGRRHLLRLEMGSARAYAMHGGRSAAAWNSRQRDLPWIGRHRFLAARG